MYPLIRGFAMMGMGGRNEWDRFSASDNTWMEMMVWFSKERMALAGLEQQELLKDKIEIHLAYAEMHRNRWERLEKMGLFDIERLLVRHPKTAQGLCIGGMIQQHYRLPA